MELTVKSYRCAEELSVEADVPEIVVLVVVTDGLDKRQCLLHFIAAAEFNLSHHVDLNTSTSSKE